MTKSGFNSRGDSVPHRRPGLIAVTFVGWLGCQSIGLAKGAPVDLGTLNGGSYASARAINGKGQIIGNALDGATLTYRQF
jgi:uncharacterized membrane protein